MILDVDDHVQAGYTYVGQEYAQNFSKEAVNEYPSNNRRNGGPVCQIPVPNGAPEGMTVDAGGILYVAMSVDLGYGVGTFGPNCGKPGPTFTESSGLPGDPAVDGHVLYLTNLINTGETPATIEVYNILLGPNPLQQLSNPAALKGIGLAVDAHHNLFWSYTHQLWSQGEVVEFPGGKMPGRVIIRIGADTPGGMLFDRHENLLLVDQNARSVNVYAPPYTRRPFSSITLKGTAVYCAMGLQQKRLYCLDYEFGAVDVYAYPSGVYIYSYTNGIESLDDPIGIAIHQ